MNNFFDFIKSTEKDKLVIIEFKRIKLHKIILMMQIQTKFLL